MLSMLQLFIDTATEKSFIGLSLNGELIEQLNLPLGLQNSKFLFSHLLELLNRQGLTPKDLGLIGCGVGPGSYTGIRVGAATAQSMAYGLRLPLVGISSLQSYQPSKPGSFAVAFDAKYGGVYLQKGTFDGKKTQFEADPHVVALDSIAKELEGIDSFITPHPKVLQERLGFNWDEAEPTGALFSLQIDEKYKNRQYSSNAHLDLLYLRKTRAEIEIDGLQKI